MENFRYRNAVHYIIHNCNSPERLGAIKLNKILLFTDGFLFRSNKKTITDDIYIKRQFGPVPKNILNILDILKNENKIAIREENNTRLFFSLEDPDISVFTPQEIHILSTLTSKICMNYKSKEISDISHTIEWEIAKIGEEINLYDYFVAEEAEITEEDIECIKSMI